MVGFSLVTPFFVRKPRVPEAALALWAGLIRTATGIIQGAMGPIWGYVADRYGRKLLVLRIMFGLGAGGMIPSMNALIASTISRSSIGEAYGFTMTASALGRATGPVVGGWIASMLGYWPPFLVVDGVLLLVSLAQRRWLPRSRANAS
jgi:DHA1 family multidrug resistance protein-like MFS transporter